MNGLFIGPYRQHDGWGAASRDYIKAISTQIKNLTIRPIYFIQNTVSELDESLSSYENSLYESYDIVFQKTLPHCIANNKKIKKNVGLFVLETNNLSKSSCIKTLNNIDEVCVPSSKEKQCLIMSGVKTPVKVVSEPIDTEFYDRHRNHTLDINPNLKSSFKFYTIGEYIERKNLLDLITAFHLAFNITDNVSLVIKSGIPGMDDASANKTIQNDIDMVKRRLNIRKRYRKEIIITHRLSDKDLVGLHNSCDCFVMPSFGEAFCRPAAEALILGNTPIVTDNTGMIDFIDNKNGYIIRSSKHPVLLNNRGLSEVFDSYNAYEHWYRPNIYSLIEHMQNVYSLYKKDRKEYEKKRLIGINHINNFSYETIGKKICT